MFQESQWLIRLYCVVDCSHFYRAISFTTTIMTETSGTMLNLRRHLPVALSLENGATLGHDYSLIKQI